MLSDKNNAPDSTRRKAHRNSSKGAGVLTNGLDMSTVHCLIRDISLSGAQIRISSEANIAYESYLIDLRSRAAYLSYPVWRKGSLMGLSFAETYLINYDLPVRLGFLKHVFVEAKLRQSDNAPGEGPAEHPGSSAIWRAALNLT